MASNYEFSTEQNQLIGGLAGKMRFVGLFAVIVGVLNLIIAALVIAAIYRDRLPAEWRTRINDSIKEAQERLPEEARKRADLSLDNLPANNHLWGIAINTAVVGLFYVLMGTWTRSAGASFQQIVDTQGSDIRNLMNGLGSLHAMYSLLYILLMLTLLFGLLSIGLTLYQYMMVR